MDRASSLIYPGSKTLAGWWRQLTPYQPHAMWVTYAFVHRIEAPVMVLRDLPVEPLTLLLLEALKLECAGGNHQAGVPLAELEPRLRLPAPVIQRLLINIEPTGFVTRIGMNGWRTTDAGLQALAHKQAPAQVRERRIFPFVEKLDAGGLRSSPAQFAPLGECIHAGWQVDNTHHFEARWLADAIHQSNDWKEAIGFPKDVVALHADASDDGSHVLLDRPERVLLVLVRAGIANDLLGFAVKVDGWTLFDRSPVVRLPNGFNTIWPEIDQPPVLSVWQDTWHDWCRQRQMPANEVAICSLTFQSPRLEVQAPSRLVQRLQAAKSDLFRGESWLLVGDGYTRIAAQLTMRL